MENQSTFSDLKRKLNECDADDARKMRRLCSHQEIPSCGCIRRSQCCPTRRTLAESCRFFLQSGIPKRVMFYRKGEWLDFPEHALQTLIRGFKEERSANQVNINGQLIIVDFLSMVLINLKTRSQKSVAWIDESNKCFFPLSFIDDDIDDNLDFEGDVVGCEAQQIGASSPQIEVVKRVVTENRALVQEQPPNTNILWTKIETLDRHSEGFQFVQNLFLSGMGSFATPNNILHVHRYAPKDSPSKVKLQLFEEQVKATKEVRGSANVQYGWYGAPKVDIISLLLHGFGTACKPTEEGILGSGVYLAPENRAFASAKLCDNDEKGLRYMILCRVILGNREQVPEGSRQCCPSNKLHDTGVDDLLNPKCYVVWATHMETYIHPEYLITFKLESNVEEYLSGLKDFRYHLSGRRLVQDFFTIYPVQHDVLKSPASPWMSFTMLFSEIQDRISPIAKELLYHHYDQLKNKIISREELIKNIKVIVGQELLLSTLMKLKRNPSLSGSDMDFQKSESDFPSRSFLAPNGCVKTTIELKGNSTQQSVKTSSAKPILDLSKSSNVPTSKRAAALLLDLNDSALSKFDSDNQA